MPEGAFYAFVDLWDMIGETLKSSGEIADHLLNEFQIVVTVGSRFGSDGTNGSRTQPHSLIGSVRS